MTKKKLKAIGIEVWKYLEEHPEIRGKTLLPDFLYYKIGCLKGLCPFCEYYDLKCSKCPLGKLGGEGCGINGTIYYLWKCARSNLQRERAARAIRKAFERW